MRLPKNILLPKDILNAGLYAKPNFFLCQTDKEKICKLETTETKGSFKFNSLSEISFETARVYNDLITGEQKINPYYNLIEALRLIYVEDFGYFELQGPELVSDGIEEKKSCTAYSLEYTLAQKYLENFYINMGTVESIEVINASSEKDIVPITLYNPSNPKLSLLHLVLEEIYGWKIGHVDPSLRTLSRQFEVDRESVYDFLMNEVCEKFNCYIIFDTINNTINVYAESLTAKFIGDGKTNTFIISPPFAQIGTVSVDGYKTTRWGYQESTGTLVLENVPEFGAHIEVVDGALTEWETDVFVSFDNLAQEVNINYDADEIKTQLTVTYGDDYDIREVNLGLPYLTDISYYYTVDWMGQDLYDAYTKYMQKSNNLQAEYIKNSQDILKWNDYISYEENRLSLEYSLVESVNSTTVGTYYTRQKNADGSYYYSEVSLPSEYVVDVDYYSNVTTNVNEEKVSNLYEILKKYFHAYFSGSANEKADALTELNELLGFEFIDGYTISSLHNALKNAKTLAQMDAAVNNFLNELWPELGRTPLQTLYLDPYKTIQQTNIEAGWSNKNNENYGYYYPTTLFISSIESAIVQRNKIIQSYKDKQTIPQNANADISDSLLMYNNFTEAQLIRLSAFLREDELHLDDIVETGLEDLSSSFKIKQDAMESGRIELQKISQPQLQFSMTMANIYALAEFEPIINQFQLGRVIRVCLRPDYIKQSRLLQVDINFDDFSDFSCEFGELTSLRTQSDIHADLLSNAISAGKSVATNSSYWTRGSDTASSIDLKIQQGLLDAATQIKAIDGTQGVIIDKYGIKLQKKIANGEIDPHQTWLVNNMILMSDDGFKTSRSALGEVTVDGQTYYGILAEALIGSLIIGSQLKIGNNSGTMTFDNNGLSITNGTNSFNVNPNSNILLALSNKIQDVLYVDHNGKLYIVGDGAGLDIQANSSITGLTSRITQTEEKIELEVSDMEKELNSKIEQTAAVIRSEVNNEVDGLNSTITQTANSIRSEVSNVESGLSSRITQNANSIASEITRSTTAEGNLGSRITQTEESITTEVGKLTKVDESLSSRITQNTNSITAEVSRATKAEDDLNSRLDSAELAIKPDAIVATVRSSDSYKNDLAALKITDDKIVSTVTSSTTYKNDLNSKANSSDVSSLSSKVSTIEQTSNNITLRVQDLENATPSELKNSSIVINTSGIAMSGGNITIQSGVKFLVNSGGTVQITAGSGEGSFINLGEAFAASSNGISATNGNFGSLTVGGKKVLTEDSLGSKIVVSSTEPNQTGIIWVCPTSVQSVEYQGYTYSSRIYDILCISNKTRTFTTSCLSSDTLPNSTYKYTVKFPIILVFDGSKETNVVFSVTATKASDSSKSVKFSNYTLSSINAWETKVIEMTVESSTNLCGDTGEINIAISASGCSANNTLYVDSNKYVNFTAANKNATGSVQACSVYYKP